MKKISLYIDNQKGFILPFVLFFIAIALISITASTQLYHDELSIAEDHDEQVKLETLLQMSRVQLKNDITYDKDIPNPVRYPFPYGHAVVHYAKLQNEYRLFLFLKTDKGAEYNIRNRLKIPKLERPSE
ncbi:hypothetical protein GCM10008983_20740 [Lentibacillus halophilus]|uniref:ComG operon protein 7 n=1 Tax=Lentibacillus halophilus TaxID=295065 RepID=A0ABP3J6E1_9BACI